ncbi:MAG: catechol 2,3-dioxygenase-like lactoylglutathione lyase family enzyme [Paracoccaceae bacterium]
MSIGVRFANSWDKQQGKTNMKVTSLDHLVLTVRDIDRSAAFYADVLGMIPEVFHPADGSARTALGFGNQKINLHQVGAEFQPKAENATGGSADLCFISGSPLTEWRQLLAKLGVEVLQGPVARIEAQGAITSIYIRDPDGNLIEISNYV